LSKAKYEYAKIERETLLEDASAMTFIDFGLLRSPYCKTSYLPNSAHVTQIIVGLMANFAIVFYQTFTNVFFYFSTFLRILTFFIFI